MNRPKLKPIGTDSGMRVWNEWAASRGPSEEGSSASVTTPLLHMPPEDLAFSFTK